MERREFLRGLFLFLSAGGTTFILPRGAGGRSVLDDYEPGRHYYGMGVDIDRCIGCGRCVRACKIENDVPDLPFYTRTWVERYVSHHDPSVTVESIGDGTVRGEERPMERNVLRS